MVLLFYRKTYTNVYCLHFIFRRDQEILYWPTQDFENRIIEHNSGETKSIKSSIPWSLV
jgi:predicted GIY-YIG superfamily endonuclease